MISTKRGSLLERRSGVSSAVQAGIDCLSVILVTYMLIDRHIGFITPDYTVFLLLLIGTMAVVYDNFAIYRANASFSKKSLKLFNAWVVTFAVLIMVAFVAKRSEDYSRLLVGQLFVLGYAAQLLAHWFARTAQKSLLAHAYSPEAVLVIGTGRLAHYLQQKISSNPWMNQKVVGFIGLPGDGVDGVQESAEGAPSLIGTTDNLLDLIDQHEIRVVYFVTPLNSGNVLQDIYFALLDRQVVVHWIPDIFALRLINHSVREIAGIPVLTLSETPLIGVRRVLKSIEDFVLAAIILVLVSPILLATALAVKLTSPGPIFFRQRRMGWNGKIFWIWKFRSMYAHQPETGTVQQARRGDARITPVGAFIRKTSLDELPQLFNVLNGDMSLVGPRPHAVEHDMEYSRRIADYFARQHIKPGITGLAQVRGFRGETIETSQMVRRVESDIEYINNWSLGLDLLILLRTVGAFTGKSAY